MARDRAAGAVAAHVAEGHAGARVEARSVSDTKQIVISAGIGLIAGAAATAYKSRKDLETQYDIKLRELRIDAYAALWTTLEPLAYYFGGELTYGVVTRLGMELRTWYFHTGGLVLSESTRPAYFNLQQALTGMQQADRDAPALDPHDEQILKALASRLRTATTTDVATRVGPRLGPTVLSKLGRIRHRLVGPRVEVTVDRRWGWPANEEGLPGNRSPAVFANIVNLTDRELDIVSVRLGDAQLGPFGLQPDENREVEFDVPLRSGEGIAAPVTVKTRLRRHLGRRATSRVPLSSELIRSDDDGGA